MKYKTMNIKDRSITYEYHHRSVENIRYELKGRHLKVVLPQYEDKNIEYYIKHKKNWIYRKIIEDECSQDKLNEKNYDKNKIKVKDRTLTYAVEYARIKYIRYYFKYGRLLVKLHPSSDESITEVIAKKEDWIYKQMLKWEEDEKKLKQLTQNKKLITRTQQEFVKTCNHYLELYQKKLSVRANRIQFRDTKRKWGSCSSKRNITLSKSLQYLPDNLIAYIIYHELCHIIELSHSPKFYELMKREYPHYEREDEQLEAYSYLLNAI